MRQTLIGPHYVVHLESKCMGGLCSIGISFSQTVGGFSIQQLITQAGIEKLSQYPFSHRELGSI